MIKACELCKGACCETIVLHPRTWGLSAAALQWVELHGEIFKDGLRLACPCKNLINGARSDYENRPDVCNDYIVGSINCREAVKLLRTETQVKKIFQEMDK